MEHENYLKEVKTQYENYPYPKRDLSSEKGGMYTSNSENLTRLNHYCFKGDMPLFRKGEGGPFRVLVAGAGTGDAVIHMAEQLRDFNAQVVYLDMTFASMKVAKKRAKLRKLENIFWVHDSLLELPHMKLAKFDYISCTGVLHHLSSPLEGLNALKSVLKPSGAMSIMLYGEYGRTGIYQMQNLMRLVNGDEQNMQNKVDDTKAMINTLPLKNWYKRDENTFKAKIEEGGDIEVYDLFLHSQDRAYSVPQLYEYIEEQGGLKIGVFMGSSSHTGKLAYRPETYIRDQNLLEKVKKRSKIEQQAIAELMAGSLNTHTFYVAHQADTIASLDDLDLIPYFTAPALQKVILERKTSHLNKVLKLDVEADKGPRGVLQFMLTSEVINLIASVDGKRSLQEIFDAVEGEDEMLKKLFGTLYGMFYNFDFMLLKSKRFPRVLTTYEMQKRFVEKYL